MLDFHCLLKSLKAQNRYLSLCKCLNLFPERALMLLVRLHYILHKTGMDLRPAEVVHPCFKKELEISSQSTSD